MRIKKLTVKIALFCLISCLVVSISSFFCAAEEKPVNPVTLESSSAFEQALAKIEAKKQEDLKKLTAQLSDQMEKAVKKWIAQRNDSRHLELNFLVEQNWEKLALTKNISPLHYDYYLRGFSIQETQSDIIKTDSMTSPYAGRAIIKEKLYVEKYHTPNISNIDPYFFTVTADIVLDIDFDLIEPVVTIVDYKVTQIDNDCPQNIKRMRL